MTSRFDSSRETVGKIYRDLSLSNSERSVECGDLTKEMQKSLVDDLNQTIASDPFKGKSFYITVYEKKDLQMPRAILRRLYKTRYRPYPEDDTVVFWVDPKSNTVKFCWCLPHHSEMDNIIANFALYDKDYVNDIRAWKAVNLEHFGFFKIGKKIMPNPQHKDKLLTVPVIKS